jgi:hypothetical protein
LHLIGVHTLEHERFDLLGYLAKPILHLQVTNLNVHLCAPEEKTISTKRGMSADAVLYFLGEMPVKPGEWLGLRLLGSQSEVSVLGLGFWNR